jgi:uncharacterized membrane protein YgdD (TMEM256/DUF423 family)
MGAHGLAEYLAKQGVDSALIPKRLSDCETAVRYQMLHALSILSLGLSRQSEASRLLRASAWTMFFGVALFSGGIYSIVFLQRLGHWSIVPSGGMLMIIGWLMAGVAMLTVGKRAE